MTVRHKPFSLAFDAETTRPGEQVHAEPDPLDCPECGCPTTEYDDEYGLGHWWTCQRCPWSRVAYSAAGRALLDEQRARIAAEAGVTP